MTPHRPSANSTAVVLVDFQEKLLAAYTDEVRTKLTRRILLIMRAAAELAVPLLVTEQYPQGLGRTVPVVADSFPAGVRAIEKKSFSCFGEPHFSVEIAKIRPEMICLLGVEAHVCIQKTAFDALTAGVKVILPADAVGSRAESDKEVALRLMLHCGVSVTTAESFVFSLMDSSAHPGFKAVSKLVKDLYSP